jgi:hypothetical protein
MPSWLDASDADLFNTLNKYDEFILAGSSLGYNTALNFDPSHTYSSARFAGDPDKDPSFNFWSAAFSQHLDIAILLHDITNIIIIDHLECGAYKTFFSKQYAVSLAKGKDLWVPPHLINMDRCQRSITNVYNNLYRPYKTYTDASRNNFINFTLDLAWIGNVDPQVFSIKMERPELLVNNGVPIHLGVANLLDANILRDLNAYLLNADTGISNPVGRDITARDKRTPVLERTYSIPGTNFELYFDCRIFPPTCMLQRKALKFYYFILDTDGNLVSYSSSPTMSAQDADRTKPTYGVVL